MVFIFFDLVKRTNIYINRQYTEITGFTLDDIKEMTEDEFLSLFHPNDQPAIMSHMEKVANSKAGEVSEIEYRFKKSCGGWVWCLSKDTVFEFDEKGRAHAVNWKLYRYNP